MPKPIFVVGDICADLVVYTAEPEAEPTLYRGGTCATTAAALANLNVPTSMIGALGADRYGYWLREHLSGQGVNMRRVAMTETFTTLVLALVDAAGERTLITFPRRGGSQNSLSLDLIGPAVIDGAGWLHTSGIALAEPPMRGVVLSLLKRASERGIPTSLDLNLRLGLVDGQLTTDFREALWAAIDLATMVLGAANEEIALLDPVRQVDDVARSLATADRTIIMRYGDGGATAVSPGGTTHAPALPVTVVNAVGAGDVFNAGMIAALHNGEPLATALKWGNAAAALYIAQPDRHALPGVEALQAFLTRRNGRG